MSLDPDLIADSTDNVEDDDAALIDSFFLPGGILDPDEEEPDPVPSTTMYQFSQPSVSRIPRNPWSTRPAEPILLPRAFNAVGPASCPPLVPVPVPSAQPPLTNATTDVSPIMRPPPGYSQHPESQSNLPQTISVAEVLADHSPHRCPVEMSKGANLSGSHDRANPENRLSVPSTCSHPESEFYSTVHQSIEFNGTPLAAIPVSQPNVPLQADSGDGGVLSDSEAVEEQRTESLESRIPLPEEAEHVPAGLHAPMNEKNEMELSGPHEHTAIDNSLVLPKQDQKGKTEYEELSVDCEPSLPMNLLTLDYGTKNESTTSSLTTLSNGSLQGQDSSDSSNNSRETENHLEALVETQNTNTTPAHEREGGSHSESYHNVKAGPISTLSEQPTVKLTRLKDRVLQKVRSDGIRLFEMIANKTALSPGSVIAKTTRSLQMCLEQLVDRWTSKYERASAWVSDIFEVICALISRLILSICRVLSMATKGLWVFCFVLFQAIKFSMIEAIEESHVTICYTVFYFTPILCSRVLRLCSIPHWAPHFLTSISVWSLCNQTRPGPLHKDALSMFRLADVNVSRSNVFSFPESPARPRDERACRTILRILRFVLPIFFFADGFSSEFGTIMGVSGSSRLTTAYMMSLVRKNLVSSPIGWSSWAIQVLIATYYPSWSLLDVSVLAVGLSSIRLVRYLEGLQEKHNKKSLKL